MSFYPSIAPAYDKIFPYSPAQNRFITSSLSGISSPSVLELGCATGSLSIELSADGFQVTGIDLDDQLLKRAREKRDGRGTKTELLSMDMLDIAYRFPPEGFDTVFSFGNSIVHLQDTDQISFLCKSVRKILKQGAPFHIQIINYDRILDQQVTMLPTIEREQIRFERNYTYLEAEHLIEFSTVLTDITSGKQSRQSMKLYPLRQGELHLLLQDAGFSSCSWYGGFDRSPLNEQSIPVVVTAR
jgi:2-polyprenyl-3-methyl-5-hydroxy-6-metoxy-1,4-benzoquinol methylase